MKVNISFESDPKFILIGKCYFQEERLKLISLLKEYKDVFAWCYDDLKDFMDGEFKHHISLKPRAIPFRQKQR